MEFGSWLRSELKRRRITMRDLANELEVNPTSVSRWASGTRTPDIGTMARIASILNVDPEVLLERTGHLQASQLDLKAAQRRLVALQDERVKAEERLTQAEQALRSVVNQIEELEKQMEDMPGPEWLAALAGPMNMGPGIGSAATLLRDAEVDWDTVAEFVSAVGALRQGEGEDAGETVAHILSRYLPDDATSKMVASELQYSLLHTLMGRSSGTKGHRRTSQPDDGT